MNGRYLAFSFVFLGLSFSYARADEIGTISVPLVLKNEIATISASTEVIRVPTRPGPKADSVLIANVELLRGIDSSMYNLDKNRFSKAQVDAIFEARNIVASDIFEGKDILLGTAGGEFPKDLKNSVQSYTNELKKMFAEKKPKDYLATDIDYPGRNDNRSVSKYISYEEKKLNSEYWASYSKGDLLKVGTYFFLVKSVTKNVPCEARVLVLVEPAKQVICNELIP